MRRTGLSGMRFHGTRVHAAGPPAEAAGRADDQVAVPAVTLDFESLGRNRSLTLLAALLPASTAADLTNMQ